MWKGDQLMGTIIVGAVLLLVVGLAVRSMIRDKKAGKSLQCGGDCKNCGVIRKKCPHHKREGNKRDVRDAKKQQNSYDHSFYDSTAYHSADAAADY